MTPAKKIVTTKPAKSEKPARSRAKAAVVAKPAGPRVGGKTSYIAAVGRRKTAVARVRMTPSPNPTFMINGKPMEQYFRQPELQAIIMAPLKLVGKDASYGFSVKVSGGGFHGQAVAVRHGLARCLLLADATLRPTLKPHGFSTRDSRMKERKKPGLKRARRAPQWSKR